MPLTVLNKLNRLADYRPPTIPLGEHRASAVLVPYLPSSQHLLYTLRSRQLKKHPGQISFPGGGIDPGESPWEAALREAWEEVGLPPERVQYLGEIDPVYSPRGYHIRCFVGLCEPFEPVLNLEEVEALVEVGIDELFDESVHEVRPWNDYADVHYFQFGQGQVWGVTGYITWRLREILKSL